MVIGLQIGKVHRGGGQSLPLPSVLPDSEKPGLFRIKGSCPSPTPLGLADLSLVFSVIDIQAHHRKYKRLLRNFVVNVNQDCQHRFLGLLKFATLLS